MAGSTEALLGDCSAQLGGLSARAQKSVSDTTQNQSDTAIMDWEAASAYRNLRNQSDVVNQMWDGCWQVQQWRNECWQVSGMGVSR